MSGQARLASIIVPCRNERRFIDAFCASVLQQELPDGWSLEIVIADGQSDDGTRERLVELNAADARIGWIDNPDHIVSCGLNRALERARGEVIVRMDVHTEYAVDYVSRCIEALVSTGADNVGGPWRAVPQNADDAMQCAVAAAFQSRWVAGGASSRRLDFDGWVDTVYLGCWPRATFERFGGFDETLVRNQDDEHNLRIVSGGGRVWQASAIRSVYRPRASLAQVFGQYQQYGYWKPFVMKKHGQAASWRHVAPGLFVLALALAGAVALIGAPQPLVALTGLYGLAVAVLSTLVARESRGRQGFGWRAAWRLPATIAAYHLSYGVGSIVGVWDAWRHGRGRQRFAVLTR